MTNSPATFQALMNSIFADLIAAGKMAVYMDDLLIYTTNLIWLRKVTREVLARLMQYDLYPKPESPCRTDCCNARQNQLQKGRRGR